MGDLDDDMSGPGDMGVLDQEKINEFRTLVRDARDAWQDATERIEAVFHANYNAAEHGRGTANRKRKRLHIRRWTKHGLRTASAHDRDSEHQLPAGDERILGQARSAQSEWPRFQRNPALVES